MIAVLKTWIKLDRLPLGDFFEVGAIFVDRDFDRKDLNGDLKKYIRTHITGIEVSFVDTLPFVGLYNFNFMTEGSVSQENFRQGLINSSDVIKLQGITCEITNHITKKFLNQIQTILPDESIISIKEFIRFLITKENKSNLWLKYCQRDMNDNDFVFFFPHFDNFQLK